MKYLFRGDGVRPNLRLGSVSATWLVFVAFLRGDLEREERLGGGVCVGEGVDVVQVEGVEGITAVERGGSRT
jgi:hypothetical protein